MALAFDAASSFGGAGAGPHTGAHSCSGAERLLTADIVFYHTSSELLSVTFNGVEMTAVPGGSYDPGGDFHIRPYYMINPPTGSQTFSYQFNGSVFDSGVVIRSWNGADQTTPYGTPVQATGSSTTPTVNASSATGEFVIDGMLIIHSGTLSVGAGQTQVANAVAPNGYIKYGGSYAAGAGTVTMDWSNTSSQFWATVAVPVKPSSGAPAGQASAKRRGGIPYMSSSFSPRTW